MLREIYTTTVSCRCCTGQTSFIAQSSVASGFDWPCLRTWSADFTTVTGMGNESLLLGSRGLIRLAEKGKELGGERGGKGMKRVDVEEGELWSREMLNCQRTL